MIPQIVTGPNIGPRKTRIVRISKEEVCKDIDSLTYKFSEASGIEKPQQADAIAADSKENLDGHIVARSISFADAKLRQLIRFCLKEQDLSDTDMEVDSALSNDDTLEYVLLLPAEFKSALLKSVAEYMHRYIVSLALMDWYGKGLGSGQAREFAKDVEDIEATLTNTLRAINVAKRPLQPFGPTKRYF